MIVLIIGGTEEHLETLKEELEKEEILVAHKWPKIRHIVLWSRRDPDGVFVNAYYHTEDNCDLNANLPSHRKHFIKKAKEVISEKS